MPGTDIAVLVVFAVAIIQGWRKGLLRSLITPIAVLIGYIFGVLNYDYTHNIVTSLTRPFFIALFISLAGHVFFFLSRRSMNKEDKKFVFWGSRLSGVAINSTWQWYLFSVVILILAALPRYSDTMENIHKDILDSDTYYYSESFVRTVTPAVVLVVDTAAVLFDPGRLDQYSKTTAYQNLFSHPKVQALMDDEDVANQIQNREIFKLVQNPKFKPLFQDESVMIYITALNKMIYQDVQADSENFEEKLNE